MGFKDQLKVVYNLPCKVKYLVYKYIQYKINEFCHVVQVV